MTTMAADDTGPGPLSQLCDREWQDLLEKDDRTSPAEYPDMVLIARNEFGSVISEGYLLAHDMVTAKLREAEAQVEELRRERDEARGYDAPTEPGAFIGDIFFGDRKNTTRGTHRWDGSAWSELPSDAEVLMDLLAQERGRTEAAQATIKALRAGLEGFGDDYMVSEVHHPNHVLIPLTTFERVRALLQPTERGDD